MIWIKYQILRAFAQIHWWQSICLIHWPIIYLTFKICSIIPQGACIVFIWSQHDGGNVEFIKSPRVGFEPGHWVAIYLNLIASSKPLSHHGQLLKRFKIKRKTRLCKMGWQINDRCTTATWVVAKKIKSCILTLYVKLMHTA